MKHTEDLIDAWDLFSMREGETVRIDQHRKNGSTNRVKLSIQRIVQGLVMIKYK
jgi:hypothetical protein